MYLYLPLSRPKACIYYGNKALARGHRLILDLEDSVQDIDDPLLTKTLKDTARASVEKVLNGIKKEHLPNVCIRINAASTPFYRQDIDLTRDIAKSFYSELRPLIIFAPKMSASSYEIMAKDVRAYPNIALIAMIESDEGIDFLNNFPEDIASGPKNIIRGVHYGHFDYCLSKRIFPFTDYGSPHFWIMTGRLLALTRASGIKEFIQTPYPYLDSDSLLDLRNCDRILRENASTIEAHSCVLGYQLLVEDDNLKDVRSSDISYAKDLVRQFKSAQRINRSFSTIGGRFIPPHEYIAAKQFLRTIDE